MIGIDLSGQTVLITGASRGIGRAMANAFGQAGANLALNYSSDDKAADDLISDIEAYGVNYQLFKCSVTDVQAVQQMVKSCISIWGAVDCLVNNAGTTRDGYFALMRNEAWNDVIDVNMNGPRNCCSAVVKYMIAKRRGVIINISSVSAIHGANGQVNYCTAKAGLIGFTKALARELGRYKVRVNALAVGMIETDMTRNLDKKILDPIVERTALRRIGQPIEVANAALFLASDLASFVTGTCTVVDGGL